MLTVAYYLLLINIILYGFAEVVGVTVYKHKIEKLVQIELW